MNEGPELAPSIGRVEQPILAGVPDASDQRGEAHETIAFVRPFIRSGLERWSETRRSYRLIGVFS